MTVVPHGSPEENLPTPPPETPLLHIGDIIVTHTTVRTPYASFPLRGSYWMVRDQWHETSKTPSWAIVLAIVGFCVLTIFSLLFLLAKERTHYGVAEVTVGSGTQMYTTRIPLSHYAQLHAIHQQVNYARGLAGQ